MTAWRKPGALGMIFYEMSRTSNRSMHGRLLAVHERLRIGLGHIVFGLLAAIVLAACAAVTVPGQLPALRQSDVNVVAEDVDVLRLTPEMHRFLDRYVLPYGNRQMRLHLLTLAVTDSAMLGFDYDVRGTWSAAEAFARRSGNCVAFANLFVALARAADLEAEFQEVRLEPEWSSRDETLVVSKHINVVVRDARRAYVIDISGRKIPADARRRILPDREARALFFNNLAVDALLAGDLALAWGRLARAIELAPRLADSWTNLGVVLKRDGQFAGAEIAYRTAMAVAPRELSAMNNLYDLLVEQDRQADAADLADRVERYRRENPYYLLALGEEALASGQIRRAVDLLQQALRLKPSAHEVHYALARALWRAGQPDAAARSLGDARRHAPREVQSRYAGSLDGGAGLAIPGGPGESP